MELILFNSHVNYIRNKSYKKLGLLKRMCKDFSDKSAIKILYFTLVRSHFDYASLIWRTNNITQNHRLSAVQNNFLRYLINIIYVTNSTNIEFYILVMILFVTSLK